MRVLTYKFSDLETLNIRKTDEGYLYLPDKHYGGKNIGVVVGARCLPTGEIVSSPGDTVITVALVPDEMTWKDVRRAAGKSNYALTLPKGESVTLQMGGWTAGNHRYTITSIEGGVEYVHSHDRGVRTTLHTVDATRRWEERNSW